jgi:5-hydroxyisourate hydrolase
MKKIITLLFLFVASYTFSQEKEFQLSTHILDISTGKPAQNVEIHLEKLDEKTNKFILLQGEKTDKNGRVGNFLRKNKPNAGLYKLTFLVNAYFESQQKDTFYPFIEVVFRIKDEDHYHVPITLSPYGYSTYRGN